MWGLVRLIGNGYEPINLARPAPDQHRPEPRRRRSGPYLPPVPRFCCGTSRGRLGWRSRCCGHAAVSV